ncbi:MAG: hypothetical protein WCQ32_03710 [bacterium]
MKKEYLILGILGVLGIAVFVAQKTIMVSPIDNSDLVATANKVTTPILDTTQNISPEIIAAIKALPKPRAGERIRWIQSSKTATGGCKNVEIDPTTGKTISIGKDDTAACKVIGTHYDIVKNTTSITNPPKTNARFYYTATNTAGDCTSMDIDMYGTGLPIPGTTHTTKGPCSSTSIGLHWASQ